MTRVSVPERGVETLFGIHDENLRFLESTFKVRIKSQGNELMVEGDEDGAERVSRIFYQLAALMKDGYSVSAGDRRLAGERVARGGATHLRCDLLEATRPL